MESFESRLNRLKNELNLKTDKQVAEILDMKPTAFAERKSRGSFPEDELFVLKAKRPDLNINVEYILLGFDQQRLNDLQSAVERGVKIPEIDFFQKIGNLSDRECLLIHMYRHCGEKEKENLLDVAEGMFTLSFYRKDKSAIEEDASALAAKINPQHRSRTTMHIDNVEQQNNIEHLEGGIHFKKGK